jgi:23S rRNA-intervening sequence protein
MAETAIVVQKAYDWNLWILPKVEKFPKSYRFSVGQNLVATSLDLLMNLVDATYQSKNSGTLAAAVKNVNRARYLVRLSKDLRLLNVNGYEFAAQGLDEIGRMAGGWWKSARASAE